MKRINRLYRFSLIIASIIAIFFTSLSPVQAGTNGQQINISACMAVRVVIKGKSPSGIYQAYTMNKTASDCGYTQVPGVWWKGTISAVASYAVTAEYPYYKGITITAVVPEMQSNSDYYSVTIPSPSKRQWIVWRANTWVTDHVPYDPSKTHDGYRQDCSGYVSFAWQLTKPGTSPGGMSAYSYQIPFDSLRQGDALNNPSAHTMLFVKWVNQSIGTFIAYEEGNPATGTRQITLILNKSTGVITQNAYYSYPGTYKAIRLNGL
jgi:hypothetical protein